MTQLRNNTSKLALVAALLAASTLAACGQNGANTQTAQVQDQPPPLPLTTTETAPAAAAPTGTALPSAPAVRVASVASARDRYAYADRAYQTARVLGDAPPDYAFDYQGTRPWVWRSNRSTRVIERTPQGQRYYYYDAGQASPYLVQDGGYSYGYSNGQLVVVYDSQGRPLDPALIQERADLAGRYLYRAQQLYNAALTSQRRAVAAQRWQERRAQIDAQRNQWEQQQQQQDDWRAYHDDHAAQEQAYWQDEQHRRAVESQQYNAALGNAYQDGRYDQRGQDANNGDGGNGALAAALAAAAAAYVVGRNSEHHDRGGPPPRPNPSRVISSRRAIPRKAVSVPVISAQAINVPGNSVRPAGRISAPSLSRPRNLRPSRVPSRRPASRRRRIPRPHQPKVLVRAPAALVTKAGPAMIAAVLPRARLFNPRRRPAPRLRLSRPRPPKPLAASRWTSNASSSRRPSKPPPLSKLQRAKRLFSSRLSSRLHGRLDEPAACAGRRAEGRTTGSQRAQAIAAMRAGQAQAAAKAAQARAAEINPAAPAPVKAAPPAPAKPAGPPEPGEHHRPDRPAQPNQQQN